MHGVDLDDIPEQWASPATPGQERRALTQRTEDKRARSTTKILTLGRSPHALTDAPREAGLPIPPGSGTATTQRTTARARSLHEAHTHRAEARARSTPPTPPLTTAC